MLLGMIRALTPPARRILVVDDEPDIRDAICELLESCLEGATVVSAESGAAGLDIMRTQRIDLIVTDYKMPGMSGVAFLKEVDKVSPSIPRIIVTAFDRELTGELGGAARAQRILQKPFEPELLLQVVEASLPG